MTNQDIIYNYTEWNVKSLEKRKKIDRKNFKHIINLSYDNHSLN